MALDTRSKRFSMMNISQPWAVNLPNPTGSFDQGDRQQVLHGYSGILWEALAAIDGRMCVAITGKAPGISITGKTPGVTFTGKAPWVTITGRGC